MSPEKALPGSQASVLPMGSVHRAIQVVQFLFVSSTSVCPGETPGEKKMMLTNSMVMTMTMLTKTKAMTMAMLTNSKVMTMTMSMTMIMASNQQSKMILGHLRSSKVEPDQSQARLVHSELYDGCNGMDGWDGYHRS